MEESRDALEIYRSLGIDGVVDQEQGTREVVQELRRKQPPIIGKARDTEWHVFLTQEGLEYVPSRVQSNVYGGRPPVAPNVNLIELEDMVPPFCIGTLLPSTADVIVVVGGIAASEITETVLVPLFVTYRFPLVESKAIPCGAVPTGIGVPTTVLVWPNITETAEP
jgi:hypothetical protein